MNLFEKISKIDVDKYVKIVEEAMKNDILVQNPEELGRWLALITSLPFHKELFTYMEIGVSAGGTMRLTRKILLDLFDEVVCLAVDDGSDSAFMYFGQWLATHKLSNVYLLRTEIEALRQDLKNIGSSTVFPISNKINACLIDAAHTYDLTREAFYSVEDLIAPDGIVAFHDTTDNRCPQVKEAVDSILIENKDWKIIADFSAQFGFTVLGRKNAKFTIN